MSFEQVLQELSNLKKANMAHIFNCIENPELKIEGPNSFVTISRAYKKYHQSVKGTSNDSFKVEDSESIL